MENLTEEEREYMKEKARGFWEFMRDSGELKKALERRQFKEPQSQ